ncbi:MAG: LysE family translocator [Gammaproteobacteria bacterium]|nr:LysE family translocator [Gammaproteobacteria bacterium]
MIGAEELWWFWTASVLLGLAPGPDNLFVLTQAALYGRRAGFSVVLGLCTGLVMHTSAVALGIAALFKTSEFAFTGLKLVGAGYLLWLAWQAFATASSPSDRPAAAALTPLRLYRRGIIMNVTNPKVSVFFLAFLPQFADPERGSLVMQFFVLGGLFILATLVVFGGITLLAGTLGERFERSKRARILLSRVAGVVFLALAVRLMLPD